MSDSKHAIKQKLKEERAKEFTDKQTRIEKKEHKDLVRNIIIIVLVALAFLFYAVSKFKGGSEYSVEESASPHITSIDDTSLIYNSYPPTSGPHIEQELPGKVFTKEIPEPIQVHMLEHGSVLIQYKCSDCDDLIKNLTKFTEN